MKSNISVIADSSKFKRKMRKVDLIFDEIQDVLFLHDFKGNIIKANKKACTFLGYTEHHITKLNVLDFISCDLFDNNQINFKQLSIEKHIRFETLLFQRDKKEMPIEITANVIEIDNTNIILTCVKDISLRKNYETQLIASKLVAEENETELNAIFDQSPASVFLFDEHLKILRANKKALEKFNITEAAIINQRFGDLINCTNTKNRTRKCGTSEACKVCKLNNIFRETVTQEKTFFKEEVQILFNSYNTSIEKTMLVSTSLLKKNGHSVFLATLDDITKRKHMEQELIEAKIMAQESDRLKSAFLNNLSHEIRTPLNGILGFIDFFNDDISLEEKKEYVKIMRKSGDRLIKTVDDLVNVSKINSGLVELKHESFSINEFVDSFFSKLFQQEEKPNVNFLLKIDPKLKEKIIHTDKLKLHNVLRNLLDNAFKFTSKGFVKLEIIAENDDVFISVQDSGIGISSEHHFDIFKPFWQVENDLNRSYDGNGLGLTVAQKLVTCLGGDLSVKSDLNNGAIFLFQLTDVLEEVPETNINAEKQSSLKDKTILICEDDLTNYRYLEAILLQENCKIIRANNGEEALGLFEKHNTIDLVLMDLNMPVMDGFEATRKIRVIKNNIPIIAQSAFVLNDENKKALKAGCNEFLSKPLTKELLINTLKKYF